MKADISAYTFRPDRHFAAVVVGQGQVLVDSTINEQEEIARHRLDVSVTDIVGASGAPAQAGGFAVTVAPDGRDLLLSTGRIYVDGILCVNDPPLVGASAGSATQLVVDTAAPQGRPFAPSQWVDVVAATTTRTQISAVAGRTVTLATALTGVATGSRIAVRPVTSVRHQPDRFPFDPFDKADPAHVTANAYRVELDVWDRYISAVEDPSIREVALGDADASSRLKVVWQVRLSLAGPVGGGSSASGPAAAKGELIASTVPGAPSDDPCVLPDEAGYRGLENQLYRVEVHSASATAVVLKWQRDNASTVSKVLSLGSSLQLDNMGRDDERGFATAAYVEVTDDALELERQVSDLLKVTGPPDMTNRKVQLEASPTAAEPDRNPRARRWDGRITIDLTIPAAGEPVPLERGLQVALVPGDLRPGDYWLIPARTANSAGGGTITWPTDDAGIALAQPPQGIRHHTSALALVDCDATSFLAGAGHVRRCRTIFSPLTRMAGGHITIGPDDVNGGAGLQACIDSLAGQTATIDLLPGTYTLPAPLIIGPGNAGLTIDGAGQALIEPAGTAEFADGLVVVRGASAVTLKGIGLGLPLAAFTIPAAILSALTPQTQSLVSNVFGTVNLSFGIHATDADALTVEECTFMPPATMTVNFLAAAIIADTALQALQVARCRFFLWPENTEPTYAPWADLGVGNTTMPPYQILTGFLQLPVTAPADTTSTPVETNNGSTFTHPSLHDARFADNIFDGATVPILTLSQLGTVAVTGNTVRATYAGFWLVSYTVLGEVMGIFEQLISNARWRNRWPATPALSDPILPLVAVVGSGLSYTAPEGSAKAAVLHTAVAAEIPVRAPILREISVIFGAPAQADFAVTDGDVGSSLIPRITVSANQVDAVIQSSYSGAALTMADIQSPQQPPPATASSLLVSGNRLRSRVPGPAASAVFFAQCTITGNAVTNEAVAAGAIGGVPAVSPGSLFVVNPSPTTSMVSALTGATITGNVLVAPATLPIRPITIPAPMNDWANFNTILPAIAPPPTVPTVTGVFPPFAESSFGTVSVIITGSGFTGATRVAFGGMSADYGVNSDTQILAFSPPGQVGAVDVTVTTPAGTSATSPADLFTYYPALQ
jgi:Family of unknown function (DUF6519)/IPT/TIG domain